MTDHDGLDTLRAIGDLLGSARQLGAAANPDYFDRKAAVFDAIVAEGGPHLAAQATEMAAAARDRANQLRAPCCPEFASTGHVHTEACCWINDEKRAGIGETPQRHYHGDACEGGHYRPNGDRCVHGSWECDHCHDDPPPGHTCPACGRKPDQGAA